MTPEEYKELRVKLGTQKAAADLLGVTRETIVKREAGDDKQPISREAELAIQSLSTNHAEFSALSLLADIRTAIGDPKGKLPQKDLLDRCRTLAKTGRK